jgi:hypothetical protein
MRKSLTIIFFSVLFFLAGCYPSSEDLNTKELITYFNDSDISEYVNDYSFEVVGVKKDGEYPVNVLLSVSGDFDEMNLYEKYQVMRSLVDEASDEIVTCGDYECSFSQLIVKSPEGNHSTSFDSYISSYSESLTFNDTEYSEEVLEEEFAPKEKVTTPVSTPDSSTSSSSKAEIYEYMKIAYDQLTNYGDSYDPDVHDPMVAQMAAEQFDISPTEAGNIYIEMEMQ